MSWFLDTAAKTAGPGARRLRNRHIINNKKVIKDTDRQYVNDKQVIKDTDRQYVNGRHADLIIKQALTYYC